MEPENYPAETAEQSASIPNQPDPALAPAPHTSGTVAHRGLRWVFVGSKGPRSGWSATLFIALSVLFMVAFGALASFIVKDILHTRTGSFTPVGSIISGTVEVLAILAAAALVGILEHRRVLEYNLTGPHSLVHFLSGLTAGFAGLSALVGAMTWGGWLHFGPVALTGGQIFGFAALWGLSFLLTGFFEEGSFRCFLQFTLARGINFWWALGVVALMCVDLLLKAKGNGVWGIYGFALLGLLPCLLLHIRKTAGNGFWQAAWVTSTLFGFIHTGNNGENWIGIFAAAAIGFVFCVSIRLTGTAWWAIGCHAAWDWAETYFYGTADSGYVATGHYLTTTTTGNVLWSGGSDGPEGSLLVLAVILLLLGALVAIYGRRQPVTSHRYTAA